MLVEHVDQKNSSALDCVAKYLDLKNIQSWFDHYTHTPRTSFFLNLPFEFCELFCPYLAGKPKRFAKRNGYFQIAFQTSNRTTKTDESPYKSSYIISLGRALRALGRCVISKRRVQEFVRDVSQLQSKAWASLLSLPIFLSLPTPQVKPNITVRPHEKQDHIQPSAHPGHRRPPMRTQAAEER